MRQLQRLAVADTATNPIDLAVVGGGPAGLMAAITAAERGRRVVLVEQLDRPAVKLLASGGGRCNLTNTLPGADFMERFGRQGRFMEPALRLLDGTGLRRFLACLGVTTEAPDGFHVYPATNLAVTVQSALWRRARELGALVRLGTRVTGLWIDEGSLKGLETDGGRIAAPCVILATGGRGYPALGGAQTGYALARQAGHTLVEPTPALVPLVTRETWPRRCAGASVSPGRVWIDLPRRGRDGVTGDVLFTHTGLSGPAALDLSGDVAALLAKREAVPVRLDLAPGTPPAEWLARFDAWQAEGGRKTFLGLLDRHLPKSLAAAVCSLVHIGPAVRPGQVPAAARRALAEILTAAPLAVTGTAGWEHAMVTRGGVSLKEVDPRTLRSKRLAGLALAGEILDLDGPSGGFNLQWAFSSGHLAGAMAPD